MRGGHQMAARGGAGERRRTRSLDERKRIVEEALAHGISVAAVARRHGLNANLIFKWIRRSREGWRDRRREPVGAGRRPIFGRGVRVSQQAWRLREDSDLGRLPWIPERSATGLREADLNVLS